MKKIFFLLMLSVVGFSSCHRSTCPAYEKGAITGAEGSRSKPMELFPKEMKKK